MTFFQRLTVSLLEITEINVSNKILQAEQEKKKENPEQLIKQKDSFNINKALFAPDWQQHEQYAFISNTGKIKSWLCQTLSSYDIG